jgi:hypothetical protein
MGDRKIVNMVEKDYSDDTATTGTAYDFFSIATANTWTQSNAFPGTIFGTSLATFTFNQGDYLEADCDFNVVWETGSGAGAVIKFALFISIFDANGVELTSGPTKIPGSLRMVGFPSATTVLQQAFHLSGQIRMGTVFPPGDGLTAKIWVEAQATINTLASNIFLTGDNKTVVRQYRLTGMAQ